MHDTATSRDIVAIAHNLRSTYNVGALLRTADAFRVSTVYCTGYTPYPEQERDSRSPALISRLNNKIDKSARGSQNLVRCLFHPGISALLAELRADGFTIAGLEVDDHAVDIADYDPPRKVAVLLGEESGGIPAKLLTSCDVLLRIPQFGAKHSLNVAVAAGIGLYSLRCS